MTSVRKRKMNRSSVGKATRRLKDKNRKINVKGNAIIAANWDYNETLAQNYKRLGLVVKLEKPAGGEEKDFSVENEAGSSGEEDEKMDKEEDAKENKEEKNTVETDPYKIPVGEARLIKDEDGNIVKIIHGKKQMDEDSVIEPVKPKTKVVEELEAYAKRPVQVSERYQSTREKDWLRDLYEKHGDDYEAMKWDKKLNVFQNSAGDLKKKIVKWKKSNIGK